MYNSLFPAISLFLLFSGSEAAHLYRRAVTGDTHCQPFSTMFPLSSVSSTDSNAHLPPPLIAISPLGSYQTTHGGLELYLERPEGEIRTKNGVNNKIAEGATVNSTFTLL